MTQDLAEQMYKMYKNLFKEHTLKLDLATVTNNGKIVLFSNLKKYNFIGRKDEYYKDVIGNYKYLIYEYNDENNKPSDKDLDDYRSLITLPYNVYNSKVSGTLILIAELCQFNDFDLSIRNITKKIDENDEDSPKMYNPWFDFGFSGDYEHIPYGAECTFTMTWDSKPNGVESETASGIEQKYSYIINDYEDIQNNKVNIEYNNENDFGYHLDANKHDVLRLSQLIKSEGKEYEFEVQNILEYSDEKDDNEEYVTPVLSELEEWAKSGFFDLSGNERHTGGKIMYEIAPSMNWGKVSYLGVTGEIDLDLIGTGYINLSTWKYYNSDNLCTLIWGLDIYEEDGYKVTDVKMDLIRITGYEDMDNITTEELSYYISPKKSYFGTFTENIPLNTDCSLLSTSESTVGQLKSNQLYLVKIRVYYTPSNEIYETTGNTGQLRVFYRFLYTSTIFNDRYKDKKDYKDLVPGLELFFSSDYKQKQSVYTLSQYGILRSINNDEWTLNKDSSFSAIQNNYDIDISGDVVVDLKNDYGMFYVDTTKDGSGNNAENIFTYYYGDENMTAESQYSYNEVSDIDIDEYLASLCLNLGFDEDGKLENYNITNSFPDNEDLFFVRELNYAGNELSRELKPTSILKRNFEIGVGDNELQILLDETVDNRTHFSFSYNLLLTIKGYATKKETTMRINSCFTPIAYNRATMRKYNLDIENRNYNVNNILSAVNCFDNGVNYPDVNTIIPVNDEYIWMPLYTGLIGASYMAKNGLKRKAFAMRYIYSADLRHAVNTKWKGSGIHRRRKFEKDSSIDSDSDSISFQRSPDGKTGHKIKKKNNSGLAPRFGDFSCITGASALYFYYYGNEAGHDGHTWGWAAWLAFGIAAIASGVLLYIPSSVVGIAAVITSVGGGAIFAANVVIDTSLIVGGILDITSYSSKASLNMPSTLSTIKSTKSSGTDAFYIYKIGDERVYSKDGDGKLVSGIELGHCMADVSSTTAAERPNPYKFFKFVAFNDLTNDKCILPINFGCVYYFTPANSNVDKSDFAEQVRKYPGLFGYFGFEHIYAQALNNIYVYKTDEYSTTGCVVNNFFYVSEYKTIIDLDLSVVVDLDKVQDRALYILLENGSKMLLKDYYECLDRNRTKFFDSGTYREEIVYDNIGYNLSIDDKYNVDIQIVEDDTVNPNEMRKVLKEARDNYTDNVIFNYDGSSILGESKMSVSPSALYVLGLDNDVALASEFDPIKISYNSDGSVKGVPVDLNTGRYYRLDDTIDGSEVKGVNLNDYYKYDFDNDVLTIDADILSDTSMSVAYTTIKAPSMSKWPEDGMEANLNKSDPFYNIPFLPKYKYFDIEDAQLAEYDFLANDWLLSSSSTGFDYDYTDEGYIDISRNDGSTDTVFEITNATVDESGNVIDYSTSGYIVTLRNFIGVRFNKKPTGVSLKFDDLSLSSPTVSTDELRYVFDVSDKFKNADTINFLIQFTVTVDTTVTSIQITDINFADSAESYNA